MVIGTTTSPAIVARIVYIASAYVMDPLHLLVVRKLVRWFVCTLCISSQTTNFCSGGGGGDRAGL